jgi:hypothetical protein
MAVHALSCARVSVTACSQRAKFSTIWPRHWVRRAQAAAKSSIGPPVGIGNCAFMPAA